MPDSQQNNRRGRGVGAAHQADSSWKLKDYSETHAEARQSGLGYDTSQMEPAGLASDAVMPVPGPVSRKPSPNQNNNQISPNQRPQRHQIPHEDNHSKQNLVDFSQGKPEKNSPRNKRQIDASYTGENGIFDDNINVNRLKNEISLDTQFQKNVPMSGSGPASSANSRGRRYIEVQDSEIFDDNALPSQQRGTAGVPLVGLGRMHIQPRDNIMGEGIMSTTGAGCLTNCSTGNLTNSSESSQVVKVSDIERVRQAVLYQIEKCFPNLYLKDTERWQKGVKIFSRSEGWVFVAEGRDRREISRSGSDAYRIAQCIGNLGFSELQHFGFRLKNESKNEPSPTPSPRDSDHYHCGGITSGTHRVLDYNNNNEHVSGGVYERKQKKHMENRDVLGSGLIPK